MNATELILLAMIMFLFGGLSAAFTFVSLQLAWRWLQERNVIFDFESR